MPLNTFTFESPFLRWQASSFHSFVNFFTQRNVLKIPNCHLLLHLPTSTSALAQFFSPYVHMHVRALLSQFHHINCRFWPIMSTLIHSLTHSLFSCEGLSPACLLSCQLICASNYISIDTFFRNYCCHH